MTHGALGSDRPLTDYICEALDCCLVETALTRTNRLTRGGHCVCTQPTQQMLPSDPEPDLVVRSFCSLPFSMVQPLFSCFAAKLPSCF